MRVVVVVVGKSLADSRRNLSVCRVFDGMELEYVRRTQVEARESVNTSTYTQIHTHTHNDAHSTDAYTQAKRVQTNKLYINNKLTHTLTTTTA